MSTSVLNDTIKFPINPQPETSPSLEFAKCECCGLMEECTPEYIARVRDRCHGHWICGLCCEAVKDEIFRSDMLITAEEALNRHMSFCEKFRMSSPPVNPTDHLISAVIQLLRRGLDSPRTVKSTPSSPRHKAKEIDGGGRGTLASGSKPARKLLSSLPTVWQMEYCRDFCRSSDADIRSRTKGRKSFAFALRSEANLRRTYDDKTKWKQLSFGSVWLWQMMEMGLLVKWLSGWYLFHWTIYEHEKKQEKMICLLKLSAVSTFLPVLVQFLFLLLCGLQWRTM